MPELPEVETVMHGLSPVMTSGEITDIWCGEKGLRIPFPDGLSQRITNTEIVRLSRRAKYILVHLSNNIILTIHLGMSGRIRILIPGSNQPPEKHDHFRIGLKSGHQIILNDARRFGMVFDLPANDIERHKAFVHLGPEPLSEDFNPEYLCAQIRNKSTAIKVAIMDQRLVVGVGNIYACEALFMAGISPKKKAARLTRKETDTLTDTIKKVIAKAIDEGGTTLRDHRLPDGNFGYFKQHLYAYGREGEGCLNRSCNDEIKRITQGGRSTFYCPSCQK